MSSCYVINAGFKFPTRGPELMLCWYVIYVYWLNVNEQSKEEQQQLLLLKRELH